MDCRKCRGERVIKSGFVNGRQRYKCKDCQSQFLSEDRRSKPAYLKALAYLLYLEGLGFRSIGRLLNVSNVAVLK